MTNKSKSIGEKRQAQETLVHAKIGEWFDEELPKEFPRPSAQALGALADELKVLLNRANDFESGKFGAVPFEKLKDVSPDEEFRKKLDAIISAVVKFQDYVGPVVNTPDGDVYLPDFEGTMYMIRAMYVPPEKLKSARGRPSSPWLSAAKVFAHSVKAALKASGYSGPLTLANPLSIPILITTKAINFAYGTAVEPDSVVSALRERDRSKKGPRCPNSAAVSTGGRNTLSLKEKMEWSYESKTRPGFWCGSEGGIVGSLAAWGVAEGDWSGV